jgi:outer membrane murein-binding lipoprotein Lpp
MREILDRLDARHDELITKLDELNAQIEAALAEFARSRERLDSEIGNRSAA